MARKTTEEEEEQQQSLLPSVPPQSAGAEPVGAQTSLTGEPQLVTPSGEVVGSAFDPSRFKKPPKQLVSAEEVPTVFKDEDGEITGISVKGRVFLGIGRDEIQKVAENEGIDLETAETIDITKREQKEALALLEKAKRGELAPEDLNLLANTNPNLAQVISSATFGVAPGVAGGIIFGGPSPLSIGAGAITGLITGAGANVRAQLRGQISGRSRNIEKHIRNMNDAIRDINAGLNMQDSIRNFYENFYALVKMRKELKELEKKWIATATGTDATPELERLRRFFDTDFRPMELRLQTAVENPDPSKTQLVDFKPTAFEEISEEEIQKIEKEMMAIKAQELQDQLLNPDRPSFLR